MKYTIFLLMILFGNYTMAADVFNTQLNIRNHHFEPNVIEVPSNTRIKITVINHDNTAEEFESLELKREKIVLANSKTTVSIGPLNPGEYKFFGEFHESTAQGKLIVR